MSVDIQQMTAHLDHETQEVVEEQYVERATSATVAFLLCFFLGYAGAHRFYLGQWRGGLARLALFALGAVALIVGLLNSLPAMTPTPTPPGLALDVVGALLILASLIWEIIDLGAIDHEVYHRNLLVAEALIAGALLANDQPIEEARQRLAEAQAEVSRRIGATATAATTEAESGGLGYIGAADVAQARALAEEASTASISYTAVSRFAVSEDPDQARRAEVEAAREGNWTWSATTPAPGAEPGAEPGTEPGANATASSEVNAGETSPAVTETTTRIHTEDGARVTDALVVERVESAAAEAPTVAPAAEVAGAAALGAGALAGAHLAGFDEVTQPSATPTPRVEGPAPEPAVAHAPEPAVAYAPEPVVAPTPPAPHYEPASEATAEPLSVYRAQFDDGDYGDITDAALPAVAPLAAEVSGPGASPVYIDVADAAPIAEPVAPVAAPAAPTEAPLYLIPEEPADAVPSEVPPGEAYVPPVASVFSAPAQAPQAPIPSWEQPTTVSAPEPTPELTPELTPEPAPTAASSGADETLAELAGLGVAGITGGAAAAFADHAHDATPAQDAPTPAAEEVAPVAPVAAAAPEAPRTKRIRVKRKVIVDGQVVAEETVEREVPADMDAATAAAQIQAELGHADPHEIARRAHLAPDTEIELHSRTEDPGSHAS